MLLDQANGVLFSAIAAPFNPALNRTLRDKAAQHRLALRYVRVK